MSLIVFELTQEHLLLLKNTNWALMGGKFLLSADDPEDVQSPFGGDNVYEDMRIILDGKPSEFNPLEQDNMDEISADKKERFDKLLNELPMALQIVLSTQSFDVGTYKAKFHDKIWKKVIKSV